MVRIHPDPPRPTFQTTFQRRGCSSIGRAPALQAGGRRFDPVQLHQVQDRPSVAREGQTSALLARVVSIAESCSLFNNSEGKGSFGSDEDPNEQRVEMYLAHPRETKGAWMGGADTPRGRVSWPRKRTGFTTYGVKRRSACGGCLGDYRR